MGSKFRIYDAGNVEIAYGLNQDEIDDYRKRGLIKESDTIVEDYYDEKRAFPYPYIKKSNSTGHLKDL